MPDPTMEWLTRVVLSQYAAQTQLRLPVAPSSVTPRIAPISLRPIMIPTIPLSLFKFNLPIILAQGEPILVRRTEHWLPKLLRPRGRPPNQFASFPQIGMRSREQVLMRSQCSSNPESISSVRSRGYAGTGHWKVREEGQRGASPGHRHSLRGRISEICRLGGCKAFRKYIHIRPRK
jgi:hypothetical protein